MPNKDLSYENVTAAGASQTEHVPYAAVMQAVHHRDKLTFLKLSWAVSAAACLISDGVRSLEENRQSLKKKLDVFSLALIELQNVPAKSLTEEQFKKRVVLYQDSIKVLDRLKKQMASIDREAEYLNDYREDIQEKFRQKMSKNLKKIDECQEEKIEIILKHLKQSGLDAAAHPALKGALKHALNDARVQEAYLQASGEQQGSSLTQKLKGWFK